MYPEKHVHSKQDNNYDHIQKWDSLSLSCVGTELVINGCSNTNLPKLLSGQCCHCRWCTSTYAAKTWLHFLRELLLKQMMKYLWDCKEVCAFRYHICFCWSVFLFLAFVFSKKRYRYSLPLEYMHVILSNMSLFCIFLHIIHICIIKHWFNKGTSCHLS